MHLPDVCIDEGFSAVRRAQLEGVFPLAVVAGMLALVLGRWAVNAVAHRIARTRRRRVPKARSIEFAMGSDHDHTAALLHVDKPAAPLFDTDVDDHYVVNASAMSTRARYVGAAVTTLLLSHSVFLAAVVTLLHCLTLPGLRGARLFVQGSVVCDYGGWQLGYIMALLLLVLVPVTLPVVAHSVMVSSTASGALTDAQVGFKRAVITSYGPRWYWWESVLLLHRCTLASLYAFLADQPVLQTASFAFVCLAALVSHTLVQPFKAPVVNALQSLLLVCLAVYSMCQVPPAIVTQAALASASDSPQAVSLFDSLSVVFGLVVPLVGVGVAVVAAAISLARESP